MTYFIPSLTKHNPTLDKTPSSLQVSPFFHFPFPFPFHPHSLHDKPLGMRLIQHRLVEDLASSGPEELDAQVIRVEDGDARVAEVVGVRERVEGLAIADVAETLDIPRAAGDDVHRRSGILQALRVRNVLVDGREALRVVDVAEDAEVDAVLVEQRLEGGAARRAARRRLARRVPGPVARDHDPGRDGAVDGREVRGQERELLVRGAPEGTAVQPRRAPGRVGRRREVRLRVDHDEVQQAVVERVPERRVRENLGRVGRDARRRAVRARRERRRHQVREAVHVVCEVLLSGGAEERRAAFRGYGD